MAPRARSPAAARAFTSAWGPPTRSCQPSPTTTPSRTRALIDGGIARAIVATGDPNAAVDGRGFARLRDAGIEVESGILREEARRLNEAFERHVVTGLPFVTLKMAVSLDGKTAARDGSSKWVTGEAARADVQRLRSAADAVMVGAGTVAADDPSLTVRDPGYRGPAPLRVVVDGSGRVPPTAVVFDGVAPLLIATTERVAASRISAWCDAGADVVVFGADVTGGVSLLELMEHLGKRDVQGVLVEGGATLAWSLVRDGLVDRVVVYVAPKLVGGADAPGALGGEGFGSIGQALDLSIYAVERIGEDLRVEADVHGDR